MFRGRLRRGLHPTVVAHITKPYLFAAQAELVHHIYIHKAHSVMLKEQGLLDLQEAKAILVGLRQLESEDFYGGELDVGTDLYMNVEKRLILLVGDAAGKMHIGRSRNDLYATSLRMLVREQLLGTIERLLHLISAILKVAADHTRTLMPGYTHWQQAQPVTLAHYLTGITQALGRDLERLAAAYSHTNVCPLGAGALATTGFRINRERVASLLGFLGIVENSYDAVASRDFVAECVAALAILMTNLSRLAEDLIIWNTQEFSVVDMPEEFSSTSSIMPQKKNPIVLEHVKGRAAHAIAAVTSVLTVLKGTSFSHSREVGGEAAFCAHQAFALTQGSLEMMAVLVPALWFNAELMGKRAQQGLSTVTELADLLVRQRKLSFRQAHDVVGKAVNELLDRSWGVELLDSAMLDRAARDVLRRDVGVSDAEIRKALDASNSVMVREVPGGPGPDSIKRLLQRQEENVAQRVEWLSTSRQHLRNAAEACEQIVREIISA